MGAVLFAAHTLAAHPARAIELNFDVEDLCPSCMAKESACECEFAGDFEKCAKCGEDVVPGRLPLHGAVFHATRAPTRPVHG